jgi:hypothetical protein
MKRSSLAYTWTFLGIAALVTMPIHDWKVPHWLVMIGTAILAARPTKGWDLHHYATMLGALLLAGISTWLKYGGPDFQVWDTPMLGLVLMVLRAMYQTPPSKP